MLFNSVSVPPSTRALVELSGPAFRAENNYEVLTREDFDLGRVTLLRHSPTGAKILTIQGASPINSFAAVVPTQPSSDSGREHATEHMAIFRSRESQATVDNYSVMSFGSYKTSLSAYTLKDYTTFPLGSLSAAEMQRMMEIYVRSLLNPSFGQEDFELEVHHLRLKRKGGNIIPAFGGVVFNEVRDYYSDPQWHATHLLEAHLFPDTHYRFDHGGVPIELTRLSHHELENFCRENYRPDRMLFILQQPVGLEHSLAALDRLLGELPKPGVIEPRQLQPRFEAPRSLTEKYPFFGGNDTEAPYFVELAWGLAPSDSAERRALLAILSEYLIGSEAAPLIRELSVRFPQAVISGCADLNMQRPYLGVTLEGISPEQAGIVQEVVLDKLQELVKTGPSELLTRTVKSELILDHFNRLNDPEQIGDIYDSLASLHSNGCNLLDCFFEGRFLKEISSSAIRTAVQQEFLDNPHRLLLSLIPDRDLAAGCLASEEARLQELVAEHGGVDAIKIESEKRRSWAKKLASTNSAEWDFKEPAASFAGRWATACANPMPEHPEILFTPLVTKEACSVNLLFDSSSLPANLLPYAGLLSDAVFSRFHPRLRREEAQLRFTASVSQAFLDFDFCHDSCGTSGFGLVHLQCSVNEVIDGLGEVAACLRDPLEVGPRMFAALLTQRLRTLQAQFVSDIDNLLVTAAQAVLAPEQQLVDLIDGMSQIRFLMELRKELKDEDALEEQSRRLLKVQQLLFSEAPAVHLVCHPDLSSSLAAGLLSSVKPSSNSNLSTASWDLPPLPALQRIDRPVLGAAAAETFDLKSFPLEERATARVLFTLYLHKVLLPLLRTSRSAYRVKCIFDNDNSLPTYLVARATPEAALEALQQFSKFSSSLPKMELTRDDLEHCKIGILGSLDAELITDPLNLAKRAFTDRVCGESPEEQQRFRTAIAAQTTQQVTELAKRLTASPPRSAAIICQPEES